MDRGIKKWAPFNALEGHSAFLSKVYLDRLKEEEPLILDDKILEINEILSSCLNKQISISYFDKRLLVIEGVVRRIDTMNQKIYINDSTIKFSSIKDIKLI